MCSGSIWFRTSAWRCLRRISFCIWPGGETPPLPVQLHWIDRCLGGAVFLRAASAQRAVAVGVQTAQVHRCSLHYQHLLFFVFLLQVVLDYSSFVIKSTRPDSQFQTVESGVYWAIVTMTTFGYGDVVPQTELVRLLASVVMLLALESLPF